MVFIHVTAICASHQRTNTHLHTTDRQIEYQSCIIQIDKDSFLFTEHLRDTKLVLERKLIWHFTTGQDKNIIKCLKNFCYA